MLTRTEQIDLISTLCDSIKKDIVGKINSGAIPEHWDGIELRAYLLDKVTFECTGGVMARLMVGKRRKQFRNTMIINNL